MQSSVVQRAASPGKALAANDPVMSIPGRITRHANASPARCAIDDGSTRLTFSDLDRRSNQLAAYLRQAGARPGACVALLFDRSADFIVAALSVLKTGAAYLPVEPSTPTDRATFILGDAGTQLLLTHRQKGRDLAGPWRTIDLDGADATAIATSPIEPLADEPSSDSLAYIIYTSGSTGRPKGVEITHANLINLIEWHQAAFAVTAADKASQVAGLAFDAAAWEIWPHLTAGASVHVADETKRRSPQALRDWLLASKITIAFVPTVLAEQLLHMTWPTDAALRTLLTGADTLHRRPAADLPFTFVNNYGPTECTVVATSGVVSPDAAATGTPSIGKAITHTRVLILDDSLEPVADGQPGELCITGAGVGRGYRNLPELTAERFVVHSPDSGPPVRLYRTGDRAALLPNGEIAFLGRLDDQVKIRGYRVELGEIVTCLDRYPGVDASAVVVRHDAGDPALIAYVIVAADARVNESDLRDFLAARLPDYMMPAKFVSIASLPVTANGKLDKSALPAPDASNLLPGTPSAPVAVEIPTLNFDDQVAAIVASLLGHPSVNHQDNFFMVGGHSMLGVQLVAKIRDTFGVKLTLRQLFGAPTVAALSKQVAQLAAAGTAAR